MKLLLENWIIPVLSGSIGQVVHQQTYSRNTFKHSQAGTDPTFFGRGGGGGMNLQ